MSAADAEGLRVHVEAFFAEHQVARRDFDRGPIQSVAPGFHALAVAPGPRMAHWTHVSVGGVLLDKVGTPPIEFFLVAPNDDDRWVERLAMTVHYHYGETLGLGHTFPLGDSWASGSALDHVLVSRPYIYGPAFERFPLSEGRPHGHLLWLLPITTAEREFKKAHGLDALESRFDEVGLKYWDVKRPSVV